jgi:carboxymethylenebutenolidase
MDQNIIDLYDEYTHAPLDRRVFLSRLTALAGSSGIGTAATAGCELCPGTDRETR